MTLDTFFKKFDTFADAPNAVAKMRELVLELAVQGKLSKRLAADQKDPDWRKFVDDLDSRIYSHDSGPPSPFEIPDEWRWIVLEEAADCRAGVKVAPSAIKDYDWVLDMEDIDGSSGKIVSFATFSERRSLSTKAGFKNDDVLYGKLRPYLNKVVIADRSGYCTTEIIPLRPKPFVTPGFLRIFLRSPQFLRYAAARNYGMKMPRLGTKDLESAQTPIPPLAEQKRIVAKVDELMALCDRLEAEHQERQEQHAALARTSLARFAEAPTPANLNLLFHKSYDIPPAELRKAILTLAVQGKLVKQDPKEGTTAKVTMEELVGRKNLKNGLSLSPTADPTDFVCLPLSAMSGSNLDCSYGKPIAITPERAAPYLIESGDIFIMRGNGSKERVGIAAMARTAPPNVLFPDLLIRIPLPHEKIDGEFFLIAWNNPLTRRTVESLAATTAGIWKINQGHISECFIPLPPLAEQRRIVAKVDELMALVDALETQLATARESATLLLDAVVAELTAGDRVEGERSRKPSNRIASVKESARP